MLPKALILEIDRLLKDGQLSHRVIAARLGVSRGTINAIATGRRGLYGKDPQDDHSVFAPSSLPERCRRCGYRVYLPCLICSTREHKAQQSRRVVDKQQGNFGSFPPPNGAGCKSQETNAHG